MPQILQTGQAKSSMVAGISSIEVCTSAGAEDWKEAPRDENNDEETQQAGQTQAYEAHVV